MVWCKFEYSAKLSYFLHLNYPTQNGESNGLSLSEGLVLDDTGKGLVVTGITDDTIAAKSGLQAGKNKSCEH